MITVIKVTNYIRGILEESFFRCRSSGSSSESDSDLGEDWEKIAEEKARGIADNQGTKATKSKNSVTKPVKSNNVNLTGKDSKNTEKDSSLNNSSREMSGKKDRYSIIEEDPQKEKEAEENQEDSDGENAKETDALNPSWLWCIFVNWKEKWLRCDLIYCVYITCIYVLVFFVNI